MSAIKPTKKYNHNSSKLLANQISTKHHVRKRYTHYPAASSGIYPQYLYYVRYKIDQFGEKLELDPSHSVGQDNLSIDLRPWKNVREIIDHCPISPAELNLSNHTECNEEFLEYLSYSDIRDSIKSLILQNCPLLSEATGFVNLCQFKALQCIDVSENSQITDEFLLCLTNHLSHIQEMKMKHCPNITDQGLIAVANRYLSNFKTLYITYNTNITERGIQEILHRCEELTSLDVEGCIRVLFVGIVVKDRGNILQYIQRKLRYLNITGCKNIQYYSLCWIGIALPLLEVFFGHAIPLLDDFIVKSIVGGCTQLKQLHVNNCSKVSFGSIDYLADHVNSLLELSLSRMDSKMTGTTNVSDWQRVFQNISRIMKLDVSCNPSIVDEIFVGPEKQSSNRLKHLNVAQTQITSYGLTCIAQSFPRLQFVDISGNNAINDTGIQAVVTCCGKTLRYFHANQCYLLTNLSVQLLCCYCPNLTELSLAYEIEIGNHRIGNQYTDDCLEALFCKAKKLRKVNLNNQSGILFSSKTFLKLFSNAPAANGSTTKTIVASTSEKNFSTKAKRIFGFYNYALESISLLGCANLSTVVNLIKVFQHCCALQQVILPYHVLTATPAVLKEKSSNASGTDNTIPSDYVPTPLNTSASNSNTMTTGPPGTYLRAEKQYRDNIILSTKVYGASKAYWQECFAHTLYTQDFQNVAVEKQVENLQNSLEIVVNTKKTKLFSSSSTGQESNIQFQPLQGFQILFSHPKATLLQFRDALVRRRLDELRAIRMIITQFRMHCVWKKFKYKIMARRIFKIIKKNHDNIVHKKRLDAIYYNSYAKKLQKFFIQRILIFKRSVNIIKTKYHYYVTKKRMHYYITQNKKIILLQKRIRGMLVRMSVGYALTQMYLKMPPIWKHVANIVAPKLSSDEFLAHKNNTRKGGVSRRLLQEQQYIAGSEIPLQPLHIKKGEIVALQEKTRSLLESIEDTQTHFHSVDNIKQLDHRANKTLKTTSNGRLHAKLPVLIPQSFDIHPYVSLSNGRTIDIHRTSTSMFNNTFQSQRKNKHFSELSVEAKAFLSGKESNTRNAHMKLLTAAEKEYYQQRDQVRHLQETKEMLSKQSIPIHIYEMKYWPMTQSSSESKKTQTNLALQDLYNPNTNNFELVMYNSREILYCEHCSTRLRMLQCSTCRKEYCFYCAIKMHATLLERNHEMKMMEPRIIVNTSPSQSLLYHIDTSKSIVYDLQNIIKFLKSTTELQALKKEREMLKKFEKEQEDLRLEILMKTNEYQERYTKATLISLLYRVVKAKEIVQKRKTQVKMENWLQKISKYKSGHLKLTKLYRKFIIRLWLYRKGFIFKGLSKYTAKNKKGELVRLEIKKKSNNTDKAIPTEEKEQLKTVILTRRVFYHRNILFGNLEEKYIEALQICEANINNWTKTYFEQIVPAVAQLTKLRDQFYSEYQVKQQQFIVANLSNTTRQKEENDKQVKYLHEKYQNMQERLENLKNMVWWLLQHLRFLYRKSLLLPVRLQDITAQLHWIQEEYVLLQRLQDQTERRIETQAQLMKNKPKDKSLYESAKEWLEEHLPYIIDQQIALDGQQQSVVEDEIIRIEKDYHDILSFDALLKELIEALYVDNQWQGEKLGLERAMIYVVYGSKESVRFNEQLITLKTKQKYLQSGTIDSLKIGLQEKYDAYDQNALESFAFLNDSPEFTLDELISSVKEKKIICKLLHPFSPSSHITVGHYLQLYSLQPWISKHAIEDIRFQERLDAKVVKYGQLQEEMDGLVVKISETEQEKRQLEKTVRDLQVKVEALRDSPGSKETVFEKQARERDFEQSQMELRERELDLHNNSVSLKDYQLMDGPLQFQMDQLNNEMDELEGILKDRKATRDKSIKSFFEFERSFCQKEMQLLQSVITKMEDENAELELKYTKAVQMHDMNRGIADEHKNEISCVVWPDFFFIAPYTWELQQLQAQQSSHQFISVTQYAAVVLQIKAHWLQTKLNAQKRYVDNITAEKTFFNQYISQQNKFEMCLNQYIDELQFHKKQRSLELDLLIRQERLKALYETRLKAMIKYKQELLIKEEEERRAREEAEKNKKSMVVQLAQNTKKAIRGVNDKIRAIRNQAETALDEEEMRMHKNIMEKNKDTLGARPEAIRRIHFTCSVGETDYFQRLQDHLKLRTLPYYHRMERSIGNQIFLWYEMTYNPDDFITELLLTHKDPMHDYYRDLSNEKYEKVEVSNDCNLVVWIKRNKRSNHGIKRLNIALTEQEEIRLGVDGYMRMEPKLKCFEPLPDLALWSLRCHKRKVVAAANTDAVIGEILNVREMMVRHPKDINLPRLLTRLNGELESCYKREVANEITNPIKVAVELMALNEEDMELWLAAFERIDKERRGRITIDEIFEFIGLVLTDIGREIFVSVDAFDKDNLIEFGDFLRAVGTFCFFGKNEVIRFLYVFCDIRRKGFIEFAHFQKFIHMLHPYEKVRAIRCLNGLAKEADYQITYEEFHRWNGEYPALYLPIFLVQDALRQKTLGVDWWFRKLSKYEAVRNKMVRAGDNTDQLVAIEIQRFQEDDAKRVRMQQRERDIKSEASEVRKTILQARQFLDEVS